MKTVKCTVGTQKTSCSEKPRWGWCVWEQQAAALQSNTPRLLTQRERICLPMQETQEVRVWSLGWEDPVEKEMATHSNILAWKIPWTEDTGRLQRDGKESDITKKLRTYTHIPRSINMKTSQWKPLSLYLKQCCQPRYFPFCDSLAEHVTLQLVVPAYRIFQDGLWHLSWLCTVSGWICRLAISLSQWSVGMLIRVEFEPELGAAPRLPSTGAFCKVSTGLCERLCWMSSWHQDMVIFSPVTKESWKLGSVVFRNPTWFLVGSACYSKNSQTD